MIIWLALSTVIATHSPSTAGDDRYDTPIEPDSVVTSVLAGMMLYEHLTHLPKCDVDTRLLQEYLDMSLDAFEKAWFRSEFHFEYRMSYLDSLLLLTDALG